MIELDSSISYAFFDSHAHYYDARFYSEENPEGAEALLGELFSNGLLGAVNIGTNVQSNLRAIEQAKMFPAMYAAVGLHPEDFSHTDMPLSAQLEEVERLLVGKAENKIVAVGEIGLDYYWQPYDKAAQAECFEAQLELARKYSLPVVIHDRDAHGDCFDTVCRYKDVRGVFHSYSGSAEMARELVRRGWYISFSGVSSFKNANKVREAIAAVPDERLLIETDAPYLAPVPYRGKLNHSGRLAYTASAVAEARGTTAEQIGALTYHNAKRLFGI